MKLSILSENSGTVSSNDSRFSSIMLNYQRIKDNFISSMIKASFKQFQKAIDKPYNNFHENTVSIASSNMKITYSL